jgi:hypothetical protein
METKTQTMRVSISSLFRLRHTSECLNRLVPCGLGRFEGEVILVGEGGLPGLSRPGRKRGHPGKRKE